MKFLANISRFKQTAVILALGSALIAQPAYALPQSSKVGFVTTPQVWNGGFLPTTNAAFSGFSFTNIPITGANPLNLSTACAGGGCM